MLRSPEDITGMYEQHVDMVYRLCYSYLKTPSDAEDATQSIFMKLVTHSKPFSSEGHEKAWLITATKNHCKDILKSAYRKRTDFDIPENIASEDVPSTENEEMKQALMNLPDRYKESMYLYYYEGYKTDEIAALVDKPASTIRNYLSEARTLLREQLGDDHER